MPDDGLRDVLLQLSPSARDHLRTALIRDDRDQIAQVLSPDGTPVAPLRARSPLLCPPAPSTGALSGAGASMLLELNDERHRGTAPGRRNRSGSRRRHCPEASWPLDADGAGVLRHLRSEGFYYAPAPLAADDAGREMVRFIDGAPSFTTRRDRLP